MSQHSSPNSDAFEEWDDFVDALEYQPGDQLVTVATIIDHDWQHQIFENNRPYYNDVLKTDATEEFQVRVLRIHPGRFSDSIVADLTTETLCESLHYEALSYTWGKKSAEDIFTITINGKHGFQVARNVFLAMRQLRRRDDVRVVWIDAVCINQSHLGEKGLQVSLMSKVFGMASCVLCWLGPCGAGPDIGEGCDDHQVRPGAREDYHIYCESTPLLKVEAERHDSWWNRIWTVQECCLAKEIKVLIGPHIYDFQVLYDTLSYRYVEKGPHWPTEVTAACFALGFRKDLMKEARGDNQKWDHENSRYVKSIRMSLHLCLERTKFFHATEPKDKLYGLAGMCNDHIDVDYKKSVVDMCIEAATTIFEKEGHLDILNGQWPHFRTGIGPSWLPDFSQNPVGFMLTTNSPSWENRDTRKRSRLTGIVKDRKLTVEGVRLDSVIVVVTLKDSDHSDRGLIFAGNIDPPGNPRALIMDQMQEVLQQVLDGNRKVLRRKKNNPPNPYTDYKQSFEQMIRTCLYSSWQSWEAFLKSMNYSLNDRSIIVTSKGYFGLVNSNKIQVGDEVVLIKNMNLPVTVRRRKDQLEFLSEAYVQGVMEGELKDCWLAKKTGYKLEKFVFI